MPDPVGLVVKSGTKRLVVSGCDEVGDEGLAESALRHRALGADEMLAAMLKDVEGVNAGVYEDDAMLIVAAL